MNLYLKFSLWFIVAVTVPCLAGYLVLVRGDGGLGATFLVWLLSLGVGLLVAFLAARSPARAIRDLHEVLTRVASGEAEVQVPDRAYGASREFAELATALTAFASDAATLREDLELRVAGLTDDLANAERARGAAQTENERLKNVTLDRELRMIELKNAYRDALIRLGEDTESRGAPDVRAAIASLSEEERSAAAMLNILEDLQEDKRMLATEKAKDEAILRSIGDGLAVADARGKVTFLNENAKALLCLPEGKQQDAVWTQLSGIYDPRTNAPLAPEELPLARAIHGHAIEKQTLLVKNDQVPEGRYLSMTATPIMVAGLSMGAVATFRDMTKEQEIDRAKTEFVSLASHQLRTPLSTINWYAEMLLAGDAGEINDEQRTYLEEVYQGNQRMVDLINSLLNVSRLELGTFVVEPVDTDVIDLAESVLKEQMPQIQERKIKFASTLEKHTPHLLADPKLLRMVLQNLLSNAVKYTPIGGSVSLSVVPDGENIAITVADTGLGIPKEEQERIFSKLYRATNARQSDTDGTGLGLYIVKAVVEHSGGTIRFESEVGKGTAFYVLLPKEGMPKKEGTRSLS